MVCPFVLAAFSASSCLLVAVGAAAVPGALLEQLTGSPGGVQDLETFAGRGVEHNDAYALIQLGIKFQDIAGVEQRIHRTGANGTPIVDWKERPNEAHVFPSTFNTSWRTPEAKKKFALREMIDNGDITLEQATAKMAAWEANHKEDKEVSEENAVALKLKKLVSEGRMTAEKAKKKMRLQTRVDSGDITLEQATAKMAAWEAKHKALARAPSFLDADSRTAREKKFMAAMRSTSAMPTAASTTGKSTMTTSRMTTAASTTGTSTAVSTTGKSTMTTSRMTTTETTSRITKGTTAGMSTAASTTGKSTMTTSRMTEGTTTGMSTAPSTTGMSTAASTTGKSTMSTTRMTTGTTSSMTKGTTTGMSTAASTTGKSTMSTTRMTTGTTSRMTKGATSGMSTAASTGAISGTSTGTITSTSTGTTTTTTTTTVLLFVKHVQMSDQLTARLKGMSIMFLVLVVAIMVSWCVVTLRANLHDGSSPEGRVTPRRQGGPEGLTPGTVRGRRG